MYIVLSELIYDHAADAYAVIFFGYTYGKVRFCEISEEVISMEETHLKELDNAAIGARIRARRGSLDMTRADLAGRIPLNEKSVAEIEYGNRGLSLKTLFRLKQILGVSTDYILEGDPDGLTEEEQKSIPGTTSWTPSASVPRDSLSAWKGSHGSAQKAS